MKRAMGGAVALFAAAALVTGCSEPTGPGPSPEPAISGTAPEYQFEPSDTTITYAFTDSSVDPDFHRSFVLTVVDGVGTVVVDAYGDEMARDEHEVSPAVVEDLIGSYNTGGLAGVFDPAATDGEDCEGGRTYSLTLKDETEVRSTDLSQCGGANADLVAALADAADPLLEPFDIRGLTDDRYPF